MADIQTYHVQTHAGIRHAAGRDEFWTQTLIVDFTGSLPAVEIRSWGRVGTKEQARFYATGVSASQAANLRVVMEGDGYRFDTRQKTYVGIIPALKDIKASCSEEHHRVAFDAVAHVVEVEVAAKRAELDARVVRRQLVDAFLNELPCPHSP